MIQRFLTMFALGAAFLVPLGCATKTFVQEEVQRTEGKMGQHLSRQEGRVGTLETGLNHERERIGRMALRLDETSETANQALAKADATDSRLLRLWASRNRREKVETVVLTFGFDKWELDDRGETTLMGVIRELKENPNLVVDLEGYTDVTGPVHYNVELSQHRVDAVRRFLVVKGIELPRIHSIGLGTANPIGDNKTAEGRRMNRRVALTLFTPAEEVGGFSRQQGSKGSGSTRSGAVESAAGLATGPSYGSR